MWAGNLKIEPDTPGNEDQTPHDMLERIGQLVVVQSENDASQLPSHVTHIKLPTGEIKRIRFT